MANEKNIHKESTLISHEEEKIQRALLVSVYQGPSNKKICEEHLDELELLARTYGIETACKMPCAIRKFDASIYIGKGKLEELIQLSKELQVDLVIFDDEITPAQQRNLQKAFIIPVMDRTEVILGVFGQRAQTKEARLQIELAKVKYEVPRLKRMWTHLSRQAGTSGAGGGGAYLKGEGEKQIEIDRRILKRKIDQLQKEIEEVRANRETQRQSRTRSEIPVFAIIGYTNAGKSTLLNALTEAGVFVEDKLFATLDTTTRKFTLKNNQDILLIDTVGFIRKLPHLLVAAFKSTLEEALEADILLHLVDVSHPMAEEQAATTYEVLKELGAGRKPIITVLNKIDKCENPHMIHRIRMSYPKNVLISALKREGFDDLQEVMIQELKRQRTIVEMRIPQSEYAAVSEIMRSGNVLNQDYEENDVLLRVDLPIPIANKYAHYQLIDKTHK
ncbi:GTPase HflX [Candidatus Protochlamydia phocaeensis]|uniref:GTPase HflX n=1 Tax=Candidatus Protochlamydia phocaeensis TaxID=1414722 RepID=UPI00083929E7|nr:GTPase HflX [Candidatus Protochlamydia phocaeensis]